MLVVTAIAAGMFIGTVSDRASVHLEGWINTTVLALIILLVIDIRIVEIPRVPGVKTWLAIVLATNFLAIPLIGFTIASLGFPDNAAVATGLAIYFMAPCTDWFLGFTRLARGNVALGAALLPINLAIQLVLAPIYLALFADWRGDLDLALGQTLFDWFLTPFVIALLLRLVLPKIVPGGRGANVPSRIASLSPLVLALLVTEIFAANVTVMTVASPRPVSLSIVVCARIESTMSSGALFARVLALVFVFFVITYVLGEYIARRARFAYPEHALFTMTTAARNAPLMLGLTAGIAPDEPLLSAAIVAGMLIEFPHLTVLKHLLLRRYREAPPPGSAEPASANAAAIEPQGAQA